MEILNLLTSIFYVEGSFYIYILTFSCSIWLLTGILNRKLFKCQLTVNNNSHVIMNYSENRQKLIFLWIFLFRNYKLK